jgi:hypothetical protein
MRPLANEAALTLELPTAACCTTKEISRGGRSMPIRNYGLHWDFELGQKGRRTKRGPVVDFEPQIGVYLLYRRKKLIYVGRSGKGFGPNIGGRLVHHSREGKLVGKWDSYSWFGFFPVIDGKIRKRKKTDVSVAEEIRDIEALLIYLLDPPENGRPGDHGHIDAYSQVTDES